MSAPSTLSKCLPGVPDGPTPGGELPPGEPARPIRLPLDLSPRRKRFAALIASGAAPKTAYRGAFNVKPTTKEGSVLRQARALLRLPAVMAEVLRVRAAMNSGMEAIRVSASFAAAGVVIAFPGASARPAIPTSDEALAAIAQRAPQLLDLPDIERYSDEWLLALLEVIVNRAMVLQPVLDATGQPTGRFAFQGLIAIRAIELMAAIKGVLPGKCSSRTLDDLGVLEIQSMRREIETKLEDRHG